MNLFGVGIFEALLVAIIGLIIVGPNKFPEMMSQAGKWFKYARAFSTEVMKDVKEAVDEIQEEVIAQGNDLQEIRDLATDLQSDLAAEGKQVENLIDETGHELERSDPPAPTVIETFDTKPILPNQESGELRLITGKDSEEKS
jgi:sec-independent protein translocase protein TatB